MDSTNKWYHDASQTVAAHITRNCIQPLLTRPSDRHFEGEVPA